MTVGYLLDLLIINEVRKEKLANELEPEIKHDLDKQNIWVNNFTPMIKDWRENKGEGLKVLDVGCNMGILVEGATNEGFDIRGVDINRLSIKTGQDQWPKVKHLLAVEDFTQQQTEEKIYDVVVLSDILSHVGNPVNLIENATQVLKDDGFIYINIVNFGCNKAKQDFHKWDGIGVGENITIFDRESFGNFTDKFGLNVLIIEKMKKMK